MMTLRGFSLRAPATAVLALALGSMLGGCSLFGHRDEHRPKTAVLGERIPVLTSNTDAEIDPALSGVPVSVPAPEVNDAWAQPGGNASKTPGNVSLAPALSRAWVSSIGKSTAQARFAAAPVIAGKRIYAIDTNAVVHAIDLDTGRKLWTAALSEKKKERPSRFGGGVSVDGDKLIATDGLGDAAALDANSGKILWKVRPAGPLRGAPAIGGGNAYVVTQDNQLFALSEDKGNVIWTVSATLENSGVFGVAAPAIAQGTVVAGFSSGELTALRYENGRVVWQDQLSRTSISTSVASISDIDASPIIENGRVYAIGQGGRMVAMDLLGGQRLWELNMGGIETPALGGDWLFVITDEAKLYCIAKNSGKIRWISQLPRFIDPKTKNKPIQWNGPVLAGGRLILTSTRGQLMNVAVADGKIQSQVKAGKSFFLAPVVANNMLLTLDVAGNIAAWH